MIFKIIKDLQPVHTLKHQIRIIQNQQLNQKIIKLRTHKRRIIIGGSLELYRKRIKKEMGHQNWSFQKI